MSIKPYVPCRRRAINAMRAQEAAAKLATVKQEQEDNKVCSGREILADLKRKGKRSRARAISSN